MTGKGGQQVLALWGTMFSLSKWGVLQDRRSAESSAYRGRKRKNEPSYVGSAGGTSIKFPSIGGSNNLTFSHDRRRGQRIARPHGGVRGEILRECPLPEEVRSGRPSNVPSSPFQTREIADAPFWDGETEIGGEGINRSLATRQREGKSCIREYVI